MKTKGDWEKRKMATEVITQWKLVFYILVKFQHIRMWFNKTRIVVEGAFVTPYVHLHTKMSLTIHHAVTHFIIRLKRGQKSFNWYEEEDKLMI